MVKALPLVVYLDVGTDTECIGHQRLATKLKDRMSKLEPDSAEFQGLAVALDKVTACTALQLEKLKMMTVAEAQKHIDVLERNEVPFPSAHRVEYTARFAIEYALKEGPQSREQLAHMLWPWAPLEEADEGEQDMWLSSAPTFAACLPEDSSEESRKKFARAWYVGIFSDSFMKAFVEASQDDSKADSLLQIVDPLLALAAQHKGSVAWATIWQPVISSFRGISALCCHMPAESTMTKDVQYLVPTGRSTSMSRDLGKFGVVLFNLVKTKGFQRCKHRFRHCCRTFGLDEVVGDAFGFLNHGHASNYQLS